MIYLNNSATSFPKPDCVVRAVEEALLSPPYDAGRGSVCGEDVTAVCRRAIAELLGVRDERVFFTSGATESFNMLLRGLPMAGKKICISYYEHNALAKPLYALADRDNIRVLMPDSDGTIGMDAWKAAAEEADYVFVNHCSNETGHVQDIRAIAELCRRHDALCICDLSQSAGMIPIELAEWGVDAAVFTGHKALFGPTGTGGFYLRGGLELECPKWGGTGRNGGSIFPTEPLDAELAERLEPLGKTMLLSRLARPFLTVRAERLIIRGIFGDSFIRVGVPERDAPEVKMLEEYINAQA